MNTKENPEIQSTVFKALSVTGRRELYEAIARRGSVDLKALLQETELKQPTVRHHVLALERAGLIDIAEEHQGKRGRPRLVVSKTNTHWEIGFPVRQYKVLAEHLLNYLIAEKGKKGAAAAMEFIGREFGRSMVSMVAEQKGSEEITIDDVVDVILPIMDEMGSLISSTRGQPSSLTISMRNCIFFELAVSHHPIVCRGHAAIFETIAEALGDYDAETLACLVKGDACCTTRIARRQ